uniref:phosphatidylinositol-3,4,5-trisphosphate 5-phosphatase n=1 Tax=Hippocampus comes TaxID=109280 RepID=A0A3Q2YLC6_HIPCM
MATAAWYHRDISRVHAEDLLARAGRDGSFLVRDSESVPEAYALCLLFQRHVHTYRILPDGDGLLAVQTTQGVQVNCFRTLEDLVMGYQHPHKGLVSPLLYPVPRDADTGDESSGWYLRFKRPAAASINILPLDIEDVHKGATSLSHLKRTLGVACQGLNSEIDLTLSSLETLAKVFDHPSCSLSYTNSQVLKALQDAVTNHNLAVQPNPPPAEPTPSVPTSTKSHGCRQLPVHSFQVKMLRYGRQTVSVDVNAGVLLFDRKASSFDIERVSHDRVLQVVKYQSSPTKVRVVIDSHHNAPREMIFESTRGNAFCQLIQLMKTRHSELSEPDVISVFVGTWNMGGFPPPRSLQSWVTCCGLGHTPDESTASLPHDIYALGTQENPQGEKEWAEHIKATLRSYTQIDFKQVAVQSLWNMRLVVFVQPQHENRISHVSTASVKTGLGNTLGNKGAVGVSFHFNGTSFGFVNCHLTSGSDKVLRRNQNFVDILRLLSLGDKHLGAFDISLRFTHLFWSLTDLPIMSRSRKHVSKREFEELMCADQLTRERHKRKGFLYFKEEKIAFPPTYRYERGSRDCYLWQKYKTSGVRVNVPSWCDRILWKSYPDTHVMCTAYGCTDDIFTSDHSPVFATFQVGVTSHFNPGAGVERAWIELEGIEAIVKTASKEKFFIDFSSSCLEETRRSSENDSQSCDVPGFLKLAWSFKQLPKLLPHRSDMDYLQDQHLLLSVKSCDGFESYGECCVALRSLVGASEQFETFLSHRGEEIGSIRGRVRLHVPKDLRGTREKTYEWFRFEKDEKGPGRGHMSPASLAATPKPTPSSYTNPAYFIFEGVSVVRGEALPQRSDPQVIWAGNEALQLPKISGRHIDSTRPCRRSDFTEIEIPAVLPQYAASTQLQTPQPNSSYELFPAKKPSPISPPSSKSISQCKDHLSKPKYHAKNICHESVLPEKNLRNLYMNQSAITRQKARRDLPERTDPIRKTKAPPVFQFTPVPVPLGHCRPAPWVAEQQQLQPPGRTGDNSLTALQIAKTLSEVDFFHSKQGTLSYPGQRPAYRNGPALHMERRQSWENEVSVLQGAPETVCELLSALGLQKYTLGLSLNGWDDLDYFSGITEDDLRAAGVTNSSHRRRILDNLPRNWN